MPSSCLSPRRLWCTAAARSLAFFVRTNSNTTTTTTATAASAVTTAASIPITTTHHHNHHHHPIRGQQTREAPQTTRAGPRSKHPTPTPPPPRSCGWPRFADSGREPTVGRGRLLRGSVQAADRMTPSSTKHVAMRSSGGACETASERGTEHVQAAVVEHAATAAEVPTTVSGCGDPTVGMWRQDCQQP